MGGHAAWRKRVEQGELAKGGGGAICRHRPHFGRKGADLIWNRLGYMAGGNPKKKKKKRRPQPPWASSAPADTRPTPQVGPETNYLLVSGWNRTLSIGLAGVAVMLLVISYYYLVLGGQRRHRVYFRSSS